MIKVGLTGGIGSGKTIVCSIFNHLGIPVFYADIQAKLLCDANKKIKKSLINLFGNDIYNDFGLDRRMLSGIIFRDKEAIQKVNAIIHPEVIQNFAEWLADHKDSRYTIHEAAILFESGNQHLFDKIITVTAPEDIRINRVMLRENVSGDYVKNIIDNQMPEINKVNSSDYVIVNDNKTLILPQVLKIHNELSSNQKKQI